MQSSISFSVKNKRQEKDVLSQQEETWGVGVNPSVHLPPPKYNWAVRQKMRTLGTDIIGYAVFSPLHSLPTLENCQESSLSLQVLG